MCDPDEVGNQSWSAVGQKRLMSLNIPTSDGSNKSSKPKIQILIDEIINDGSTVKLPSGGIPQKKVAPGIVAQVFQEQVLPKPSLEIVVAIFQEEPSLEVEEQDKSPPRTK